VSDTSQGPGWWLASDGKWYRPEQHPNYRPPPNWPAPPGAISQPSPVQPLPTRRKRRIWLTGVAAVFVAAVIAVVSGGNKTPSRPPHLAAPTTALAGSTTTTIAIPAALQASAEAAAGDLISSWASGNRPEALSVATSRAVATLFAVPYPSGMAIDRGCSSAFPPIVCTYGPPGGGPSNVPIFQIYVSQTAGGWYVSSAVVES
jgi:hypothetical protein